LPYIIVPRDKCWWYKDDENACAGMMTRWGWKTEIDILTFCVYTSNRFLYTHGFLGNIVNYPSASTVAADHVLLMGVGATRCRVWRKNGQEWRRSISHRRHRPVDYTHKCIYVYMRSFARVRLYTVFMKNAFDPC